MFYLSCVKGGIGGGTGGETGGGETGGGGGQTGGGGGQTGGGKPTVPVKEELRFVNVMFQNFAETNATIVPSKSDASELEIPAGQSKQFYYEELNTGVAKAITFSALDIKESSVSPLKLNNFFSYAVVPRTNNKTLIRVNVTSLGMCSKFKSYFRQIFSEGLKRG